MSWLKTLRDAQYEFNKINSGQIQEVSPIRWLIDHRDAASHPDTGMLEDVYRHAYLALKAFDEDQEFQRFATSPVRNAYWSMYTPGPYVWNSHIKKKTITTKIRPPEILEHFDPLLLSKPAPTMIFKRFGNLLPPEELLDILVKALLGFPQPMGYKYGNHCAILDDSGVINLRSTERENIMMDSFLRGCGGQSEELKKALQEKQMIGIDISGELVDLLKVYTDAEEHLLGKEKQVLQTLESVMKRYLEAKDERTKVSQKLNALKGKLAAGQPVKQEECDCDEDEDE